MTFRQASCPSPYECCPGHWPAHEPPKPQQLLPSPHIVHLASSAACSSCSFRALSASAPHLHASTTLDGHSPCLQVCAHHSSVTSSRMLLQLLAASSGTGSGAAAGAAASAGPAAATSAAAAAPSSESFAFVALGIPSEPRSQFAKPYLSSSGQSPLQSHTQSCFGHPAPASVLHWRWHHMSSMPAATALHFTALNASDSRSASAFCWSMSSYFSTCHRSSKSAVKRQSREHGSGAQRRDGIGARTGGI